MRPGRALYTAIFGTCSPDRNQLFRCLQSGAYIRDSVVTMGDVQAPDSMKPSTADSCQGLVTKIAV